MWHRHSLPVPGVGGEDRLLEHRFAGSRSQKRFEAKRQKNIDGEARIVEPPASRQNTVHKIETAKAVWSEATQI